MGKRYFPNGLEVFSKRVKAGEKLIVPGDFALNAAPLVIAVPVPTVHVKIMLRDGHEGYGAGEKIRLHANFRSDSFDRAEDYREEWAVRTHVADAEDGSPPDEIGWTILPADELTCPWTADKLRLDVRLRLFASDGYQAAEDYEVLSVKNKSALYLYSPRDGQSVDAGKTVGLAYEAYGADGHQVNVQDWLISRDGKTWTKAELRWGTVWTVPSEAGPLWLKAVWEEIPGRTKEQIIKLTIRRRRG